MARRLSRRVVSSHVAERLVAGDTGVVKKLAAYLIDARQVRNLEIFVRDVEEKLLDMGHAVVDVTSHFSLTDAVKAEIEAFVKDQTGAKDVSLRTHTDESVLGGARIRVPGRELDATIARHLTVLRTRLKKA